MDWSSQVPRPQLDKPYMRGQAFLAVVHAGRPFVFSDAKHSTSKRKIIKILTVERQRRIEYTKKNAANVPMALYFAYGSNLSVHQMKQRCSSSTPLEVARLPLHRLSFSRFSRTRQCGVADIVPHHEQEVWGLLYDVSLQDLCQNLDRYEGCPDHYRRIILPVEGQETGVQDAWVYSVVNKEEFVPPSVGYLEIIKKAASKFGFPHGYRLHLETVETLATA